MVTSQGEDNEHDLGENHGPDHQLERLVAEVGFVLADPGESGHQEENVLAAFAHYEQHWGSQEEKGSVGEGPISEKTGFPSVVPMV